MFATEEPTISGLLCAKFHQMVKGIGIGLAETFNFGNMGNTVSWYGYIPCSMFGKFFFTVFASLCYFNLVSLAAFAHH